MFSCMDRRQRIEARDALCVKRSRQQNIPSLPMRYIHSPGALTVAAGRLILTGIPARNRKHSTEPVRCVARGIGRFWIIWSGVTPSHGGTGNRSPAEMPEKISHPPDAGQVLISWPVVADHSIKTERVVTHGLLATRIVNNTEARTLRSYNHSHDESKVSGYSRESIIAETMSKSCRQLTHSRL